MVIFCLVEALMYFFITKNYQLINIKIKSKVKLWDVLTNKQCVRTYSGHTGAVRDLCFSNDGLRFLSAGYDKIINY